MSDQPTYYTPEQVADIFGLASANYLREHIASLPHVRIARQVRFTAEHVEAIGRMHEQTPAPTTNANAFGRRTRGT